MFSSCEVGDDLIVFRVSENLQEFLPEAAQAQHSQQATLNLTRHFLRHHTASWKKHQQSVLFPEICNPYAAGGSFGQYKMMQKTRKMTENLAHGYSSEGTLSEGFPMNTNMTDFRWFSKVFASLCFG